MSPITQRTISQSPGSLETPLGTADPTVDKLVEYGGFVSAMLALCLFFKVLTHFVMTVKED